MTSADLAVSRQAPGVLTGRWRTVITPSAPGAANMAMDHALMERARASGEGVFRVYSWSAPTLSLGRNQVARDRLDPDVLRARGVALVRRPTGGRALLHHREVTYSVTAPLSHDDSVRAWYAGINEVLLAALRALGVDAAPAETSGRAPVPATASCFAQPDEGEITVAGRKLVGSALLRQQQALLQHGSILLDDDQSLLDELLPDGELRPAAAGTLREALGEGPSLENVARALFTALRTSADVEVSELGPDERLRMRTAELERHYDSDDWTFRY